MTTDLDIARSVEMENILSIADKAGFLEDELELYGKYKAKISPAARERLKGKEDGKLILVTAMTPTPAGEGKSTVSIGLLDGLRNIGKNAMAALREPSLGPVFGMKGGATGGGRSQVLPMEDINLHFTGDIHAITAANNLLAAMIDNHLQHGNSLGIDPRRIVWKRALDMNDRALRNIVIGLGGPGQGLPREDGFMITTASEIMALFCLADDLADLKKRLGNILVAYDYDRQPVYARDLNAQGAMAMLLSEAIKPNLVQTLYHSPVLIHGGPFANIAHGCNSVIATRLGLKAADYLVTEAGFGADLGAEKFLDIKCRTAGLKPDCIVVVATIRALKMHGGIDKENLNEENKEAIKIGFANLNRHIMNMKKYGPQLVVALNRFSTDSDSEIDFFFNLCRSHGFEAELSDGWSMGGEGCRDLAKKVVEACDLPSDFKVLYDEKAPIRDKVNTIVREIYGGRGAVFSQKVRQELRALEKLGLDKFPVCIAKTQYSFSDKAKLLNAPEDFDINIKTVRLSAGAAFIVCEAGDIMTMPGLPKIPSANNMDIDEKGRMTGLF